MRTTIVLVHGAWHGAWCFDPVIPLLRLGGVEAVAIDLPGHGADRDSMSDLYGDAAHVSRVLDEVAGTNDDGDIVLLGHSYGGAVITQAGDHPAVRELIYLCAFPLDETESCAVVAPADADVAAISHVGRPNLGHAFVDADDGTVTLSRSGALECLYNGVDAATANWALDHLGPQSLASLGQTPTAVAWRGRPSTYVVCADDQAVHPDLQRIMARRCSTILEWNTGHSPFLSHPELVADLLLSRRRAGT